MPISVRINGVMFTAKPWHRMPCQGILDPVPIRVNGKPSEAQLTEGGAPLKMYSYFRLRGSIYYVPGHVEPNAEVLA